MVTARKRLRIWPSRRRLAIYGAILATLFGFIAFCTSMPGKSFAGTAAPLDAGGLAVRADLERNVRMLAAAIGPRHLGTRAHELEAARDALQKELESYGYTVTLQDVHAGDDVVQNLEAVRSGSQTDESFVVGAHYDSVDLRQPEDCPGADDNASGVAVTLALAKRFAHTNSVRTLRFVLFVNEEPPYFWQGSMGSLQYARAAQARHDRILGMWSLETLGYFRDEPDSQHYAPLLQLIYPSRGNFVGFVGNTGSRDWVRDSVRHFRGHAEVRSEGAAPPEAVQGVGWSDHWSFWQIGVPALMVTDTAPFRNPHYHEPSDRPETLDYDFLTRTTLALGDALAELADAGGR